MNTRGLVMEVKGNKAVILTPTGEFKECKLKNTNVSIGEEISVPNSSRLQQLLKGQRRLITAAAAVFLILIIPFMTKGDAAAGKTMAYLSVDINPSIELALNKDLKVINTKAMNNDADLILKQTKLSGLTAQDAIVKITDQAYKNGFLSPNKDNAIMLALTPADDTFKLGNIENSLKNVAQDVLTKDKLEAVVQTITTTPGLRKDANTEGLSPGKYAILLEAVDSGLDVKTSDLEKESISMAIKNAGGNISDFATKDYNENKLDKLSQNYKDKMKHRISKDNTLKEKDESKLLKYDNENSNGSQNKEFSKEKGDKAQFSLKNDFGNNKVPSINKPMLPKPPQRPRVENYEKERSNESEKDD